MEIIRAFELTNNGVFTARLLVRNNSGDVVSSKDIAAGKSATIDLNQHLNTFKDGDTIMMGVKVVGGRSKTSTRKFIYRAGALDKAKFEISGITITNKLTFVGTKNAYEYHFLDDQDNTHNINGINYLLCPKDSVAVVLEPSEEYKGAVKIPSTITYQKKKYVVTEIGNQAFGYCHELTSLTLPASICFIGDFVFIEDFMLKSIRVENDTPPYVESHGVQEFDNIDSCILSVPLGSVDDYKNAFGWEQFKNIKAYRTRRLLERLKDKLAQMKAKDIVRRKHKSSQD